jgi:hypothetical protein
VIIAASRIVVVLIVGLLQLLHKEEEGDTFEHN